jgi:hypothetical protein
MFLRTYFIIPPPKKILKFPTLGYAQSIQAKIQAEALYEMKYYSS